MPRFPQKLWNLIEQDRTESIKWNAEGDGLMIDHNLFTTHFLQTKTFKTSRMASFVRQLNLYGFRKVGGGPLERNDEIDAYGDDADLPYLQTSNCNVREYKHRFFNRNRPELLPRVRRISGPKTGRKRRPRNANPDGSLNTSVKRRRVADEQVPVPPGPPGSFPMTHGFTGPGPGHYFPASYPHLPSQYPVQLHYAQDYAYPHHPGAPEFIGQHPHPGCSTGAPGASPHFYPPPGYPMSYPDGAPVWQGPPAIVPNSGEGSSFYPPPSSMVGSSGGGSEVFNNGSSIQPYSASAPLPFPHPIGPPPGSFFQQPGAKSAFTPTSHLVENLLGGKMDQSAPGAGPYAEPQLTSFHNYGHYQHYPASGMYQEGQLGGHNSTQQPLSKQNSDETTENESTEENSEDENSQEDESALVDGSTTASGPPPGHPPPQLSGHIESANVRHFRSAELMALESEKNLQSNQAVDSSSSDRAGDHNWLPSVLSLETPQKSVIASQTGASTVSYYPACQVSSSTEGADGVNGGVFYSPEGAAFISEPYSYQQQHQHNAGLPSISMFAGQPPPGSSSMPKVEPPQYDEVSAAYKAAFSSFSDERLEDDIKPSVLSGQRNDSFATMQPLVQPHYSAHEYNMQYGYFGGASMEGLSRDSAQTPQYANPGLEYSITAQQPAVVNNSRSATGPLTSSQTTVSLKMSDSAPRDVKPAGLRTPGIGGFTSAETLLPNHYTMIGEGLGGQVQSAASGVHWDQEPHLLVQSAFPGCHGQPASHLFDHETTIGGAGIPYSSYDIDNGGPNVYCAGSAGHPQFHDLGQAFMPASECRTPAANMARLKDDSGALNTPKTTMDDQSEARATVVGTIVTSQSCAVLAVPGPNDGAPRHPQSTGLETEADDEHNEDGHHLAVQVEARQEAQSPQIDVGYDGSNNSAEVAVGRCSGSAAGLGQQLADSGEGTDVTSTQIHEFVNRGIPEAECCCGENDEQRIDFVNGRKHFVENILKGK